MRYGTILLCLVPLLALGACDDDGVTDLGPPESAATVRFINAAVDIGAVDLRFPDRVETLPTLMGVAFQNSSGFYQRVGSGNRVTRVFPNASDATLTSTRLVDTQLNLVENQRYTMVYAGRTAAGAPGNEAARLEVIEDPAASALPSPGQGQIAVQALHAAVGVGAVDVYLVAVDSVNAPNPADWETVNAGVLRNVGFLGRAASYATVPALTGSRLYRFIVTATGSTTPLFRATPNAEGQAGAAGSVSAGPRPGTRISGSVLTAVIMPGSTPGSRGSTAANQIPTVLVIADKVMD